MPTSTGYDGLGFRCDEGGDEFVCEFAYLGNSAFGQHDARADFAHGEIVHIVELYYESFAEIESVQIPRSFRIYGLFQRIDNIILVLIIIWLIAVLGSYEGIHR